MSGTPTWISEGRRPRLRRARRAPGFLSALLLSACMQDATAARPEAAPGDAFEIVESDGRELVVEAGDRLVAIAPPEGLCVDRDAARAKGAAFVVLIGACADAGNAEAVTSLTLGDKPLIVGGDRNAAFDQLAAFLKTAAGREGVGMGGDADSIRIIETRRSEDTLFVLVEDGGARVADAHGARFWRAFTEVNGRSAIASRGVTDETPDADAACLLRLSGIMNAIKQATREEIAAGVPEATG